MEKISVASLDPPDHCGWLTKQGGSIKTWKRRWMVLKGTTLYYFKTQKDVDVTGNIDLEPDSFIREEAAKSKAKKFMFSVGTSKRVFMMFAETAAEQKKWINALKVALDSLRGGAPTGGGGAAAAAPAAGGGGHANGAPAGVGGTSARDQLARVKAAVSFLKPDSKVLEFWQIWIESVPAMAELDTGKRIDFTVAVSADLQKLTWRTSGPQNIFIQKMVDFFWNVGAPETEIDRLNDVGALINPVKIGSWIDMSAKDGMDGGWYFPVPMALALCIEAADAGEPTQKLAEWAQRHGVEQCMSVGRDMGAAPPRQTEFRLALPGDTAQAQMDVALAAFAHFNFPALPDALLNVLKANRTAGLLLSVITSSEGFVRLGVLQPSPSAADVEQLCAGADASLPNMAQFQNAFAACGNTAPAFAEYQYLQPGFGYGVYKEGFDIVFHFDVGTDVGQ